MERVRILFAPGAGAPSTSDWMVRWAGLLGELGEVARFDYDYMAHGRRRPDPHAALVAAHLAAIAAHRSEGDRLVLVGKSMGSRIGCHVADEAGAAAVVCLGYPLVGQSGKLRDEVLVALRTPILFVQGTRDAMCPLELLETVRARMTAPSALHVVETGDHSLEVTKSHTKATGRTQDDEDRAVLDAIRAFLSGL